MSDEAAEADLLLGGAACGDLGPVAARRVDEFDRSAVRSGVLARFLGAVAFGWRQAFNVDRIVEAAINLKSESQVYRALLEEFAVPSDEFVRMIAARISAGRLTPAAKETVRSLIVSSIGNLVRDRVNERLTSALTVANPVEVADGPDVMLGELVKPYQQDGMQRVVISGDDVAVGPGTATAVALVIHELATNSMKYGALSAIGGEVMVTCTAYDQTFVVGWTESGGPIIDGPPAATGFGTGLAERAVKAQLGARLDYRWLARGLTVSISAPRANLAR